MGGFPRMVFDADINLVADGNSLTAGIGGFPWPNGIKAIAPMNGLGAVTNCGLNGQTTAQMTATASDVDGAWVAGKKNILVAWEGTNSICNVGRTALQAAQDMADYIAARRAAHVWNRVVLITCLPRQTSGGQAATTAQNAQLDAYNDYLRANYRAMGADALLDIRAAGSPFNIPDYQMQSFEDAATNGLWAAGETGNHIHLSSAGYNALLPMIGTALRRLRR